MPYNPRGTPLASVFPTCSHSLYLGDRYLSCLTRVSPGVFVNVQILVQDGARGAGLFSQTHPLVMMMMLVLEKKDSLFKARARELGCQ